MSPTTGAAPGASAADALTMTRTRTFPASQDHASEARRFLAEITGPEPWAADAALCLSEMFNNALLHSASARPGGLVVVRITRSPVQLLAEVRDDGGPWRGAADVDGQSGRGLMIVEALAATFGVTGDESGRTAWFTFDFA